MASNKDIVITVIILTSVLSFATLAYGTISGRWYSCRSQTHPNQFDVVFSLWEVCDRTPDGDLLCRHIEDVSKFEDVLLDFKLIRTASVLASVVCALAVLLAFLNFTMKKRKGVSKYTIITQTLATGVTVVLAISTLVYASVRAQDIVGDDVKFVFGWGCVITWVGTIFSFLNAILSLILICMYFDEMRELNTRIAEDMNFDNISMTSTQLNRIANGLEGDENNTRPPPPSQNSAEHPPVNHNSAFDNEASFPDDINDYDSVRRHIYRVRNENNFAI